MNESVVQIRDDLFQTRMDSPFPGLTTHAYLWRRPVGNVLFYSPAGEADFDEIDSLGGISAQYLSHLDEAGPNLNRIAEHGRVDVALDMVRHVESNDVEVLPTPGHSPGSTAFGGEQRSRLSTLRGGRRSSMKH